jgi:hypothetical protein
MSIARRLVTSAGNGEVLPFQFQLTVGNGQLYELPLVTVSGTQPNIQVSWGDGSSSPIIQDVTDIERYHTYTSAGTYTVSILGSLPGFRVDNSVYKLLYTSIIDWGNVGLRSVNFYGCTNITTIPGGAIGLSRVTQFNNTFRSTSITSIPSDLFTLAVSAESFTDTFSFTKITSVPANLFDSCTSATSFSSTFNACTSLVSVPTELFRYNTQVINFSSTFRNNRALTNIPTFQYNPNVTVFLNIFNMSSTTNGSSSWGSVEALWDREPEPLGTNAFNNCTGITNYASIPVNWK